jgi:hypothetical protein
LVCVTRPKGVHINSFLLLEMKIRPYNGVGGNLVL